MMIAMNPEPQKIEHALLNLAMCIRAIARSMNVHVLVAQICTYPCGYGVY
jgi:hypothetical protein